jgi:hypothetical protein
VGLRFQKRIGFPGGRINISRGGVSLGIGERGSWLTFGKRGIRATAGLPGSGVSYTTMLPRGRGRGGGSAIGQAMGWLIGAGLGLLFWAAVIHAYGG